MKFEKNAYRRYYFDNCPDGENFKELSPISLLYEQGKYVSIVLTSFTLHWGIKTSIFYDIHYRGRYLRSIPTAKPSTGGGAKL